MKIETNQPFGHAGCMWQGLRTLLLRKFQETNPSTPAEHFTDNAEWNLSTGFLWNYWVSHIFTWDLDFSFIQRDGTAEVKAGSNPGYSSLYCIIITVGILSSQYSCINHASKLALKGVRKRQAKLHIMGKHTHSNWLRRELHCLRNLKLRLSSAFLYDKILLLVSLQILLQNITNILRLL